MGHVDSLGWKVQIFSLPISEKTSSAESAQANFQKKNSSKDSITPPHQLITIFFSNPQ
jgi:hypothetical protein